jgi:hypothetical protein
MNTRYHFFVARLTVVWNYYESLSNLSLPLPLPIPLQLHPPTPQSSRTHASDRVHNSPPTPSLSLLPPFSRLASLSVLLPSLPKPIHALFSSLGSSLRTPFPLEPHIACPFDAPLHRSSYHLHPLLSTSSPLRSYLAKLTYISTPTRGQISRI